MYNNQLTGPIPSEIGDLMTLRQLDMANNMLTGTIPTELNSLPTIARFHATVNRLTGDAPTFPLATETLTFIELQHEDDNNNLTLAVDEFFREGRGRALEIVMCHECNLKGFIPTFIGESVNLARLVLTGNSDQIGTGLTGTIPAEIGGLQALTDLRLSRNSLSQAIPTQLANLPMLEGLSLDGNQFTGEMPPEVASMPSLTQLELHDNPTLTGDLDTSVCNVDGAAARFSFLSSDCGSSGRVACTCCDDCF